jgi:hypothetical protein
LVDALFLQNLSAAVDQESSRKAATTGKFLPPVAQPGSDVGYSRLPLEFRQKLDDGYLVHPSFAGIDR